MLIASGVLLSRYWWGFIFVVNVPIVILAIGLGVALVPPSRDGHDAPLDPLGAVLALVGFASLVFGIIEGPERGWPNPMIIGVVVGGATILFGFVRWELRVEHPMLDPHLFRERRFSVGLQSCRSPPRRVRTASFVSASSSSDSVQARPTHRRPP